MDESIIRAVLSQGLPALGMGEECIPSLLEFSRMLLEKNQVMNLTAITDPQEVATLHLLDSLALAAQADLADKKVIDVGTGAGFPGMPLAIAVPGVTMTLLDSLGKRVDFLKEVCKALELQDISCVHARAEEFAAAHRESYDFAVSRAVASLPVLCELCLPLVKVGGAFLAMKSSHSQEETDQAAKAISLLGGKLEQVTDYSIPTTTITHRLLTIRKVSPTPKKYPRRFAQIKKQPLGVPGV